MPSHEFIRLNATIRTALGKKNRAIRRAGLVPLHVYGFQDDPLLLQVEGRQLLGILRRAGRTSPVSIAVDGNPDRTETVLVRDVSRHPVSGDVVHVDFIRVSENVPVDTEIPITLTNIDIAPVTRGSVANVTQSLYSIKIKIPPFNIPKLVEVDCSHLSKISDCIFAKDVLLPQDAVLTTDPYTRVLFIQISRAARSEAGKEQVGVGQEQKEE